jgi:hypothetical protein
MGLASDEGGKISVQVSGLFSGITEYNAFSKSRPEERRACLHRIHIDPRTPSKARLSFRLYHPGDRIASYFWNAVPTSLPLHCVPSLLARTVSIA